MKERVHFKYKGKEVSINVKRVGFFSKGWGLMFSQRENARALLFNFKKPVDFVLTSLFVFYSFYVIWIDEKGKVIELRKIKPFKFSISPKKKFSKLIEIPINKKYKKLLEILDGY